jgi:hypothetical protein
MSDARTESAPKTPLKDIPAGKQEKKTSPSAAGIGFDEPAPAQTATERPDLITDEAVKTAEHATELAADAVREEVTKALPTTGDVRVMHDALLLATRNVETIISTTNVAIRGAEEITQSAVEYGQRNLEQLSDMVRHFWEVRSVGDLVALHREHTRAIVEDMLEETTRIGQHLTKTLGEIVETAAKQPRPELTGTPQQQAA